MINTNNFSKLLGELLREYYQDIKNTGITSPDREQFIKESKPMA